MATFKSRSTLSDTSSTVLTDVNLYDVTTHAPGPAGRLPLQAEWLRDTASGDVFGWTQNAAMGWQPDQLGKDEYLILSTQGGIRAGDGTPVALGYHTGHWRSDSWPRRLRQNCSAWAPSRLPAMSAIRATGAPRARRA